MDPKFRAQLVEESEVSEAVKQEAREDALGDRKNKRKATEQVGQALPVESNDPDANVRIDKVGSKEDWPKGPEGLTLVDSDDEEIPFHPVSDDLARYSTSKGGEAAAQPRRRR